MRFNSINIYSDEGKDGIKRKRITCMLRSDSNGIVDKYLALLKYYDNDKCKSLNIACNEDINKIYLQYFAEGYPVLHYPLNLSEYEHLDSNKDKFWLDVINNSIKYVSRIWDWDYSVFEKIYNNISNYIE